MEGLRTCKKCGTNKPLVCFPKNHQWRRHTCKLCVNFRARDHYHQHPLSADLLAQRREAARRVRAEWKLSHPPKPKPPRVIPAARACTKCAQIKPLTCFYKQISGLYGRRAICSNCGNVARREAFRARPELVLRKRAQQRAFAMRRTEGQKAHRRNVLKKWKDAATTDQRKRIDDGIREWRKNHPAKIREYARRHAALKRSAQVGKVSYDRILERDGMHCYLCDSDIPEDVLSFDHVVPLSRGGAHSEDNIKPAHVSCNCRKRDKFLHELVGASWLKLVA